MDVVLVLTTMGNLRWTCKDGFEFAQEGPLVVTELNKAFGDLVLENVIRTLLGLFRKKGRRLYDNTSC